MRKIGFSLEPGSGLPPYLQIVKQVEFAIALGHLNQGDQLPTVKEIVEMIAINPNTVLKAFRELEYKGITHSIPGKGTFIVSTGQTAEVSLLEELRRSFRDEWLILAAKSGLSRHTIEGILFEEIRSFDFKSEIEMYE